MRFARVLITLFVSGSAYGQQWTATFVHPPDATSSEILAGAGGQFGGSVLRIAREPTLWPAPGFGAVSLYPPGAQEGGRIYGMTPAYQVGQLNGHAFVWFGSSSSRIDLNPAGAIGSHASAASGGDQFGYVGMGNIRASKWSGTAQSWVDLHPAHATDSRINAAAGPDQGGAIFLTNPNSPWHAAMWSGSASTFRDLHPPGAGASEIQAMAAGQQAGYVHWGPSSSSHAVIWSGTPESAIDIHPSIAFSSAIFATNSSYQVGHASHTTGYRAALWRGTAASFLDLHDFLPPQYTYSRANAIIEINGTVAVGGWASIGAGGNQHAVVWTLIPSPGAAVLIMGLAALGRRTRHA